jgi:N-acetylglucosaminyldiphosphoundecaprenol N-acetyl-beta-D-mannosaminyltransferase
VQERQSIYVAGLKVTSLSIGAAVDMFLNDARGRRSRVYAFVNGHSAVLRRKYPDYARALDNDLTVGVVDGAAVELAAKLRGEHDITRCPGPDFFAAAAEAAARGHDIRFYLLGGAPGVAERVKDSLVARYPSLNVVGASSPPYGEWDDALSAALIAEITSSGANALWLGVSAPKQEIWAIHHAGQLGMPVACVGAAFDFVAGTKPRAPMWVRAARLEWAFRLLSEPARMWYRYIVGNSIFVFDAVRYGRRRAPGSE